ncbi:sialoadhesin-like [Aulostomus maculatus]
MEVTLGGEEVRFSAHVLQMWFKNLRYDNRKDLAGTPQAGRLCADARWKMRLLQVSAVLCFAAVCALQDPDSVTSIFREDSSTESPTAAPPSVYEPPVPFLQLLSSQLDVFPSEKVQFSCTVNGSSDWTFTWFRDKQPLNTNDPDLSFTAQQEVLTISRVSPAHAGTYSCKGHDGSKRDTPDSNQLELTVYPFIPKPTVVQTPGFDRMFPGESVTFECLVDVSSEWDYLWYHNNHEIQVSSSKTYEKASIDLSDGGRYHCKAKRSKEPFYTEESTAATLQVSEPPTPVLELLSPWSDVFQYEIKWKRDTRGLRSVSG